ncbi:hypothetical protein JHW43_006614 [Diplocarpon mali]|nr:hypothetical protein JHW43_006614 [Diplocarpon mali]
MQLSRFPVPLLASLAAAQTTTFSASPASTNVCGAKPVLDQCLGSTQLIAAACFNVCPDDTRLAGLQNTKDSYCAYATTSTARVVSSAPPSPSTSTAATATAAPPSSATRTQSTSGSALSVATGSRTTTASAASASETGKSGAGKVVLGAGGVLMGLAGFAGAFL